MNNGDNVNVAFFITKDDQRLSGFDAAQNYQKFSKAQLGNWIKYDVSVAGLGQPRSQGLSSSRPLRDPGNEVGFRLGMAVQF